MSHLFPQATARSMCSSHRGGGEISRPANAGCSQKICQCKHLAEVRPSTYRECATESEETDIPARACDRFVGQSGKSAFAAMIPTTRHPFSARRNAHLATNSTIDSVECAPCCGRNSCILASGPLHTCLSIGSLMRKNIGIKRPSSSL